MGASPNIRAFVTVGLALGLCASAATSLAAGPPDGVSVTVINGPGNPVPVALQGSSSVTGSVAITNTAANPVPIIGTVGISPSANAVSIRGTPSVNIATLPAVASGDRTAVAFQGRTTFSTVVSRPIQLQDLTQYKMVKLVITAPMSPGTSRMEARVYETRGSTYMLIDKFPVPDNFTGAVRYYEMPGNQFSVEIINSSEGVDQTYEYILLGRNN